MLCMQPLWWSGEAEFIMSFLPATVCFCDSVSVLWVPTLWVRHLHWRGTRFMFCTRVRGHSTDGYAVWQEELSVNHRLRCSPCVMLLLRGRKWHWSILWTKLMISSSVIAWCWTLLIFPNWSGDYSRQLPNNCQWVLRHNIKPFSSPVLHGDTLFCI